MERHGQSSLWHTLNTSLPIMKPFGILAWPAFSTKEQNPYNYILYSSIKRQGHQIYEFDIKLRNILKYSFSFKYSIFHIHWPTHIFFGNSEFKARLRLHLFFFFINWIKLFGKKVVWTVHNLEAHECKFPRLQKQLDVFLYRKVDGFISLNKSGLDLIRKKAENKGWQDFAHILHPHYKNYYLNEVSRIEARQKLGVAADQFVFLFLGQIRAYKNVTGLIKAYKNLKGTKTILLIAGNVHQEVEAELKENLKNAEGIVFSSSFVKDEDLQLYFNCADVVVTPYERIFNSGSAFLNLSFNKPTLVPEVDSMAELKQLVGSRWIKTYQGQISAEVLEKNMAEVVSDSASLSASSPDSSHFDPESVALETITFFNSLLHSNAPVTRSAESRKAFIRSCLGLNAKGYNKESKLH